MVSSIGPFWDANETWLVLAIGILLAAFPAAHGMILTALYLPVAVMLIGLILRGVAFEFRAKVAPARKGRWNAAFHAGSLMTSLSQGYMLGVYVMGLQLTWFTFAFSVVTAVFLSVAYSFIGATWLILKTDGALQRRPWAARGAASAAWCWAWLPSRWRHRWSARGSSTSGSRCPSSSCCCRCR